MINLHANCKERLIETLTAALAKIQARGGMFIASSDALFESDEVLPRGKPRDQLIAFVDEFPVYTFVTEWLDLELLKLDQFRSDVELMKLTDIKGFKVPRRLARRLVAEFESLPWEYNLTFRLPDELSGLLPAISREKVLNDKIRLVRADGEFRQQFRLEAGERSASPRGGFVGPLFGLVGSPPRISEWDPESVYLQIGTNGFIGPYTRTLPLFNAERLIRAVCGLGLALRLFDVKHTYNPITVKSVIHIHRKPPNKPWQEERSHDLIEETSRGLNSLTLHLLGGWLDSEEKKQNG